MSRDRTRGPERARTGGDKTRGSHDRLRIAHAAARLIVEHGLVDWALAKRKAARQLMLPESCAFPSNDEIEAALVEHHALFGGEAHGARLKAQRTDALGWMRRLAAWDPVLVGGVAAGWATAHSDARIELVADDPKAVEMMLAGAGIGYAVVPPREHLDAAGAELFIATPTTGIRLSILAPQQRRNRRRDDDEARFSVAELAALIAADRGERRE